MVRIENENVHEKSKIKVKIELLCKMTKTFLCTTQCSL